LSASGGWSRFSRAHRADSLDALLTRYDDAVVEGAVILNGVDKSALAATWRLKCAARSASSGRRPTHFAISR
jgi:hypothetical protein